MTNSTLFRTILLFTACVAAYTSFAQAPTITSFSPASGPVGTLVTVIGTNLSSPTGFTIGGVSAIVVSDNGTTLVGMVMTGAAAGSVSVTTAGGSAASASNYTVSATPYPNYQQGPKLIGTGAIGASEQGSGVAVSADGKTAIVGGPGDNGDTGAVWIYTRSGSIWTQQGTKLVPDDVVGQASQTRVALSADGNTAILGSPSDSLGCGAVWIFARTGSTWAQQGPKFRGTGSTYRDAQGYSVALSADGNTAVVGATEDSLWRGAIWVFTRSGGVWTQQGPKLIGAGYVYDTTYVFQGQSVAISADGNTIIESGNGDNYSTGAAWVFTRSAGVWTQQGPKLVGTGAAGQAYQGFSCSLSADGNTAVLGGPLDSFGYGATWIFTRSGGVWTQQGPKLVGSDGRYGPQQGKTAALSADGNTAFVGADDDSFGIGAVWVFTRTGSNWTQRGKLVGAGAVGYAQQGGSIGISADGTTGIVGGWTDNNNIGAAWVFSSDSSVQCSPDSSFLVHANCAGDSFLFGTRYLILPGLYYDTLTNAGGCDSIVRLDLGISPPPMVSLNWDSLVQANVFYTHSVLSSDTAWVPVCSPNIFTMYGGYPVGGTYTGEFIHGDTADFTNFNSSYWGTIDTVTYTYTDLNGCTNSATDTLLLSQPCEGINNISSANTISLYPNPNHSSFTLQTSNAIGSDYTITDMLGDAISQDVIKENEQAIEIKDISEGVYTLVVRGSQPIRFVIVR